MRPVMDSSLRVGECRMEVAMDTSMMPAISAAEPHGPGQDMHPPSMSTTGIRRMNPQATGDGHSGLNHSSRVREGGGGNLASSMAASTWVQTDSYEWSSTILDVRTLRGSTKGHVNFFSSSPICRALDRLVRFRRPEAHRRWTLSWVLWDYDLEEGADISKAGLRIDLSADQ
ncbi:hypothetical protein CF326_g9444 [Tilletia indica]|nr:hypothetical protein CF326_g9444 [Tilletia indica]